MKEQYLPCKYLGVMGDCGNPEKAGENAGTTPINGQPFSCKLANNLTRQIKCPGYDKGTQVFDILPTTPEIRLG